MDDVVMFNKIKQILEFLYSVDKTIAHSILNEYYYKTHNDTTYYYSTDIEIQSLSDDNTNHIKRISLYINDGSGGELRLVYHDENFAYFKCKMHGISTDASNEDLLDLAMIIRRYKIEMYG
jgi:hypothetical protein